MEGKSTKWRFRKVKQMFTGIIIAALALTAMQLTSGTITNAATSSAITLNYAEKTLKTGDKLKLKATITKTSLKSKSIVWKSSKATVATITQKGVVTAKKAGSAKITATIKGTKNKATCKIKVINKKKTESVSFTVNTEVRIAGDADKSWKKSVDAKLGDKVEFQIVYKNTSDVRQEGVVARDILPSNLKFVSGSTWLANGNFPNGTDVEGDNLFGTGLFIGNYAPGANAIIRFYAEVVDDTFTCGKFILRNWGRASVNSKLVQDSADVNVQLAYCPDPEEPNPDTPVNPDKPSDVPADNSDNTEAN